MVGGSGPTYSFDGATTTNYHDVVRLLSRPCASPSVLDSLTVLQIVTKRSAIDGSKIWYASCVLRESLPPGFD